MGVRVSVLTPALNTAHFATALRHFGFPRTAGAFWERGPTPVPNGSSPEPPGGGDCAASAEEHRALRLRPELNKEGLFNVAVRPSPSATGANTMVRAALLAVRWGPAVSPLEEGIVSSLHTYSSPKKRDIARYILPCRFPVREENLS